MTVCNLDEPALRLEQRMPAPSAATPARCDWKWTRWSGPWYPPRWLKIPGRWKPISSRTGASPACRQLRQGKAGQWVRVSFQIPGSSCRLLAAGAPEFWGLGVWGGFLRKRRSEKYLMTSAISHTPALLFLGFAGRERKIARISKVTNAGDVAWSGQDDDSSKSCTDHQWLPRA